MPKKSSQAVDLMSQNANPEERFDQWRRRAGRLQPDAVMQIMARPEARISLYKVFAHTDYLARCCLTHPDAVITALTDEPSLVLSQIANDLRALDRATGPNAALASAIKPLKERAVVAIGLADISGKWTHEQVGSAISDMAERILDAGLGWLTRLAYRHGEFTSAEEMAPVPLPGLFILGGGDFAAEEPSYCGPLEVAVIYDPKVLEAQGIGASEHVFSRVSCELADALGNLNKEGSIFELVNYRSTKHRGHQSGIESFALSVTEVRELLHEDATSFDRAWFAGARVIAGDRNAGGAFSEEISADMWSQGMNADDIEEAVKMAADHDKGAGAVRRNPSHDAHWRLVQTFRLALGQHHDEFRHGSARSVFEAAGRIGAIDELTAERIASNYDFYSVARNRLNLIRGEASQEVKAKKLLASRAALCGFNKVDLFDVALKGTTAEAEQHWLNIINEPDLASFDILGRDAVSSDPTSQENQDIGKLEDIGFEEGRVISSMVDNWLKGEFVSSADEPNQRLSAVAPGLLTEFAATQEPDLAITCFDTFLQQIPAEEKPFEQLRAHESISNAIVDLFGNATRFGNVLARNQDLIKEALDPDIAYPSDIEAWFATYPTPRRHGADEQVIETLSAWLWESRARVCLAAIRGDVDCEQVGVILSSLTDEALNLVYEIALSNVDVPKGKIGKGMAIIAMGDYGTGNVSVATPLDLVFVYDPDSDDGASADAIRYYTEVAQSIMDNLTTDHDIGAESLPMFEVDTRHRPGGTSGEIASSIRVYKSYFVGEADARDQLALTSARVICGPDKLKHRLDESHTEFLTRPRQGERVLKDVDKARSKEARLTPPASMWDLDYIRGGFVDLKIVVQGMQMTHGPDHPYVLCTDMCDALLALGRAGCIDTPVAAELAESVRFWRRLKAVMAFTNVTDPASDRPRQRLAALLANAAGVSDYSAVEPLIRGHAERTMAHYNHLILGGAPGEGTKVA